MSKPTGKLASACETLAEIGSRIEALLAENDSLSGLYKMHQQTESREMLDLRAERDALLAERDSLKQLLAETRTSMIEAIHWEDLTPVRKRIETALQGEQP